MRSYDDNEYRDFIDCDWEYEEPLKNGVLVFLSPPLTLGELLSVENQFGIDLELVNVSAGRRRLFSDVGLNVQNCTCYRVADSSAVLALKCSEFGNRMIASIDEDTQKFVAENCDEYTLYSFLLQREGRVKTGSVSSPPEAKLREWSERVERIRLSLSAFLRPI